jgi:hypothetical protein
MSIPITAIVTLHFSIVDVLLVFGAPCQLQTPAGQKHGQTIPVAVIGAGH